VHHYRTNSCCHRVSPNPRDQSSPNSGSKCQLVRPLTVPNFIALGQTVYEKSVIIFYTLHYFGTAGGTPWAKVHQSGCWYIARPSIYKCAKFRPVLTTSVQNICSQNSPISLTAWHTETQTKKSYYFGTTTTVQYQAFDTKYQNWYLQHPKSSNVLEWHIGVKTFK